jgi:hypothetical protein
LTIFFALRSSSGSVILARSGVFRFNGVRFIVAP